MSYAVLVPVSRGYPPRQGIFRCIPHPSATRHPGSKLPCAAVRLACVRPTASVHSEPGSNSSLKFCGFGSRRTSANLLSAVVVTELQNHSLALACLLIDFEHLLRTPANGQFTHLPDARTSHLRTLSKILGSGLSAFFRSAPTFVEASRP